MKKVVLSVLLGVFIFNGCSTDESVSVKKDEVVEESVEKTVTTDDDALEDLVIKIQEEMRIFDVVEHHDALLSGIESEMTGSDEARLKEITQRVVKTYMDEHLKKRITELLTEVNPQHKIEERDWVFHQVSTQSLYRFITLYEVAFYKDKWEW